MSDNGVAASGVPHPPTECFAWWRLLVYSATGARGVSDPARAPIRFPQGSPRSVDRRRDNEPNMLAVRSAVKRPSQLKLTTCTL